jgi:hypothetical protein
MRQSWKILALCVFCTTSFTAKGQEDKKARPPHWPFTPVTSPPIPGVTDPEWQRHPIDAFIHARMAAAGLQPAPLLSKRALLRRLAFDLTGLPPTPAEMKRFLSEGAPDSYAQAIDYYLASPRYGEHWARHWLDVVRYAETDGFAIDGNRPTLWRYRDYVVRNFNEDTPFDSFIREQIAGDEINAGIKGAIATGFYRLGPWEADNMTPEVKRQDYLNEVTGAVGAAFLGLTLDCARCHDHKYDPIPARDYYRLQAFLAPIQHAEVPSEYLPAERNAHFDRNKSSYDKEMALRKEKLATFRSQLRQKLAVYREEEADKISEEQINKAVDQEHPFSDDDKKMIRELTKAVETYIEAKSYASVAWTIKNPQKDQDPVETFILGGGDVGTRMEKVSRGFLSAVPSLLKESPPFSSRAILAQWITHPDNPLTPRVLANRIWLYHFGEGIVQTANDFGRNGSGASHPELLDYLASRLVANNWRLKPLHREILLSRAYRLSTQHSQVGNALKQDPDNLLLWRGNHRRLTAEMLRDTMLAVSGKLSHLGGGPGFFEKLPKEMGDDFPFFKWKPSSDEERSRRSIYMFQRRNMVHPMMESFDVADASESCARRDNSLHPLQAFDLLNSELAHASSNDFAKRILAQAGADPGAQTRAIFLHAFSRPPSERELALGVGFLKKHHGTENALAGLCLVIFNTNEFIYIE